LQDNLTRPAVPSAVPYTVTGGGQLLLVKHCGQSTDRKPGAEAVRQSVPRKHLRDRARVDSKISKSERLINAVKKNKLKMQARGLSQKAKQ